MMRHTSQKKKPKHRWKFRGIVADSKALGVNRNTLYRVLTGQWHLPGLSARYRDLKFRQTNALQ